MNDVIFRYFLYIIGACYVIGTAILISKKAAIKNADIVLGTVVDIVPRYRSAEYTVEIVQDGVDVYHTFTNRTGFSRFRLSSSLNFYVIVTPHEIKYKAVRSYYSIVWYLFTVPWLMLFAAALDL